MSDGETVSLSYDSPESALADLIAELNGLGYTVNESSDIETMKVYVLGNAAEETVTLSAIFADAKSQLQYIASIKK